MRSTTAGGPGQDLSRAKVTAAFTLAIDQATGAIVAALGDAGVESILLKGPTIARWLYAAGPFRGYGDIDLLVEPSRLLLAEQVLQDRGYRPDPLVGFTGDVVQHAHAWMPPGHGGTAGEVDLHRSLPWVEPPEVAWPLLYATTETWNFGGVEVRVLSEAARALHVALHAAHNGRRVQQSLDDLGRACTLVPRETWKEAAALGRELGVSAAMRAGLELISEGTVLANQLGLVEPVPFDVVLRSTAPTEKTIRLGWVTTRGGINAKLALAAGRAFPSPTYLRSWTALARRGRVGLALAYPYRLGWLMAKAPATVRELRRVRRGVSHRAANRPAGHNP